jgi:glutaminase
MRFSQPQEFSSFEMKQQLDRMIIEQKKYCLEGEVASYIPELAKANPEHLAVSVCTLTGETFEAGDADVAFTLQSISKVITLALSLMDQGEEAVFKKVGMEPTGDPFNSIVKLETIRPNKPLNPMINAGAIAVSSLIKGSSVEEKLGRLLHFFHELSGNCSITYNPKVAESEAKTADLNRALTYFMKEHGVIEGAVDEVLDLYFKQCAIEVCCRDLARVGAVFANDGKDLLTDRQIIPIQIARICKTFMVTCGMYNASGEFAIRVGIPAKSGVSGGILATIPGQLGIAVLGPTLDDKGNSVAGVAFLEAMSRRWQLSIF